MNKSIIHTQRGLLTILRCICKCHVITYTHIAHIHLNFEIQTSCTISNNTGEDNETVKKKKMMMRLAKGTMWILPLDGETIPVNP